MTPSPQPPAPSPSPSPQATRQQLVDRIDQLEHDAERVYRAVFDLDPDGSSVRHYLWTLAMEYNEQANEQGRGASERVLAKLVAYEDAVRVLDLAADQLYQTAVPS